MWEQEKHHKAKFEELINKYRVRPTVMVPLWNVAGFALGAGKLRSNMCINSYYLLLKKCEDENVWTFIDNSYLQSYENQTKQFLVV